MRKAVNKTHHSCSCGLSYPHNDKSTVCDSTLDMIMCNTIHQITIILFMQGQVTISISCYFVFLVSITNIKWKAMWTDLSFKYWSQKWHGMGSSKSGTPVIFFWEIFMSSQFSSKRKMRYNFARSLLEPSAKIYIWKLFYRFKSC